MRAHKQRRLRNPRGRVANSTQWHPKQEIKAGQDTVARLLKRQSAWVWHLLLVFILTVRPVGAEGLTPSEMQAGGLLMRMQNGYITATSLNTEVAIQVNGLVARVSVKQEFRNDGSDWVEGIYVFPLPDKAAVDHMRLHIGDRFIEAEIREKQQAKEEYEQARQAGKKTSLVEQQRANLFTSSVANIAPGETVIVEIEYLEDLRFDDGIFSLRFPMTLTPRYMPGQALPDRPGSGWSPDTTLVEDASLISPPMVPTSNALRISLRVTINAGMSLDAITSRYHPVSVVEANGRYTVTLDGGTVPMDHDFELLWRPVPASSPRAMAFSETINGEPYYLLMVMPPALGLTESRIMPREMTFVVDTSGSMQGVSMEQAKQALIRALNGLRPGDKFNIIEFNSITNALFTDSAFSTAANIKKAQRFVQQLQANGGTEMRPALELALSSPPSEVYLRQIVFITDGSVGNEDALFSLIEAQLGASRLFTVGIGSAPNSWFMHKAAEAGRGTFTIISALHEVAEKMDRLFRKLEHPQVTNIDVQWPDGTVIDSYPSIVPDLYLGEPVIVKARATGEFRSGETVRISGASVDGPWSRDLALDIGEQSSGVGALWARARIADLLEMERRGANPIETRAAVVNAALAHHLVSKYTSLIAVDKTPVRPATESLAKEQIANLIPYGQSGPAIFGFPSTATNAVTLLQTGIAYLLAAFLLWSTLRWRRWVSH